MTVIDQISSAGRLVPRASVADVAGGFGCKIRELARQMELACRLDDTLVAETFA